MGLILTKQDERVMDLTVLDLVSLLPILLNKNGGVSPDLMPFIAASTLQGAFNVILSTAPDNLDKTMLIEILRGNLMQLEDTYPNIARFPPEMKE